MNSTQLPQSGTPTDKVDTASRGGLSLRLLRIVFVAMFLSVVVYALIGTFMPNDVFRTSEELAGLYRTVSFVGGLCVAGLLLIRNLINRWLGPVDGDPSTPGDAQACQLRIARIRRLTLLAFVLSEAIAVLGILFVVLGGERRTLYIFCAISLACLILFFPKDSN